MKKVKDFFKDCLEEIGRGILHEYGITSGVFYIFRFQILKA